MNIKNNNLRKIRREKDLTQEYIAFELGISQKAYSDIENGKTKINQNREFKNKKSQKQRESLIKKTGTFLGLVYGIL